MSLFRRIFAPKNSVILLQDPKTGLDAIQSKIEETKKYYRFTRFEKLIGSLEKKKPYGYATLVINKATKHFSQKIAPYLLENKIPFLVLADPECIGTNRLALEDEIAIFEAHYDQAPKDLRKTVFESLDKGTEVFDAVRKKLGPLPLDSLDPLDFYCTWGELIHMPPELRELGFPFHPAMSLASIKKNMELVAFQQQGPVRWGACLLGPPPHANVLTGLGLQAVLTPEKGPVSAETSVHQLPHWHFETQI